MSRTIYELRMEVLRRDTPSDNVALRPRPRPRDPPPRRPRRSRRGDRRLDVDAAAVPRRPDEPAMQLRGMAVARRAPGTRPRRGDDRRRASTTPAPGAVLVWANARDSALDFYVANGFAVVGEGFRTTDTDLPHHRIVKRAVTTTAEGAATATAGGRCRVVMLANEDRRDSRRRRGCRRRPTAGSPSDVAVGAPQHRLDQAQRPRRHGDPARAPRPPRCDHRRRELHDVGDTEQGGERRRTAQRPGSDERPTSHAPRRRRRARADPPARHDGDDEQRRWRRC